MTGWAQLAFGLDWSRPPRQMIGTAFWYVQTDQWRYDRLGADLLASPLGDGRFAGKSMIDTIAQSARSGWMPSYPQFNRSSLDVVAEAEAAGQAPAAYVTEQLKSGDLKFAIEDPDAEENWPRILTVWRANLLGSSSKGNEYFLRHLLGTSNAVRAEETPEGERPQDVTWRDEAPEGKLDLLVSIDFRMTSTGLFGDILLPAATWYEKHDLSTTDMHPYVHAFTPAIDPPVGDPQRLRHLPGPRPRRLGARARASRGRQGPRRRAAAARHPGRDGRARRRGARLEDRRGRPDPRRHRTEVRRRRA